MFRRTLLTTVLLLSQLLSKADEGMWLPSLLKTINADAMYSKGLKIPIDSLFSLNSSSIKDAIVQFGGGCTGEIIGKNGLLLTNYHCGYSQVVSHSSVKDNYLTNGFWAMSMNEELPCAGLTATFIVRMEDVTESILPFVNDSLKEIEKTVKIKELSQVLVQKAIQGTHYDAEVKPFYYGNKYFLIVTEKFKDVRLVGAPPSSIGKFADETDNWMWPRQTGDFALFRIYADKNNNPADYSKENLPYKPKYVLPISLNGIKENDFTMVYGFPGRTQEYLPMEAVRTLMNHTDPVRIELRKIRLNQMEQAMEHNDTVRIQYSSKHSSIKNGYTKWQGEILGLKRLNALGVKSQREFDFFQWAKKNSNTEYQKVVSELNQLHIQQRPLSIAADYYFEAIKGIELLTFAETFSRLEKICSTNPVDEKALSELKANLLKSTAGYFKNYDVAIDKAILPLLLKEYIDKTPEGLEADLSFIVKKHKNNIPNYCDYVFKKTVFADQKRTENFIQSFTPNKLSKLLNDPAYSLIKQCSLAYASKVLPEMTKITLEINNLQKVYMKGQMEMAAENKKNIYPDANFTLRITYGKVEGYEPRDGIAYKYYTTLDGVAEKYDSTNYDFNVPEKLLELHKKKDYGRYATDGKLVPCFLASNHTTGGNSGSPVLNGQGQLIGINFDRVWEGTMSDIMFDPAKCRNITLDIRYVLFIVDKFAGAKWLTEEMNIVQ